MLVPLFEIWKFLQEALALPTIGVERATTYLADDRREARPLMPLK